MKHNYIKYCTNIISNYTINHSSNLSSIIFTPSIMVLIEISWLFRKVMDGKYLNISVTPNCLGVEMLKIGYLITVCGVVNG